MFMADPLPIIIKSYSFIAAKLSFDANKHEAMLVQNVEWNRHLIRGSMETLISGNSSIFRVMGCTICKEKMSRNTFRWWRQSHYQSLHADYARAVGRWYRNFFARLGLFLVALLLTQYLWLSYGGLYATIWVVTILSFIAFCVYEVDLLFRRISRHYLSDWKDRHPSQ